MVNTDIWAKPEDFATLFQYLWLRDFPIDQKATGAFQSDWTIHIGVVVRSIADLMGFVARFESGRRTDAVIRSTHGDEIAIEWEWEYLEDVLKRNSRYDVLDSDSHHIELRKLKNFIPRPKNKETISYAVLITYTHTNEIREIYSLIAEVWEKAKWPLLLILIDCDKNEKFRFKRKFKNINATLFKGKDFYELRTSKAFPGDVDGTRWKYIHEALQDEKKI